MQTPKAFYFQMLRTILTTKPLQTWHFYHSKSISSEKWDKEYTFSRQEVRPVAKA